MPVYTTSGKLVEAISAEHVGLAQDYLTQHPMAQFVNDDLKPIVEFVEWRLNADGQGYTVTVVTNRDLTVAESLSMSEWISGQNSDGLGEGFEQQDFAWVEEECDEDDICGMEHGRMASFDWETNECLLVKQS